MFGLAWPLGKHDLEDSATSLPDADLLHRDGFKAEFEGGRVGLEAEIILLPIYEHGIGDETVFVPAFGLPGGLRPS